MAGQHFHAGEACGLDGGGSFVEAVGQAGGVVGVGGDDDLAAHLVPLAQQPGAGVEVLAVTAVDAAGVHFQQAAVLFGHLQCLEGGGLVAGRFFVEELAGGVQLLDEVDVGEDVGLEGRYLLHLGKVRLDSSQRVAVKVVVDAVVQVLRAEIDLVILTGVFAVEVVRRANPVIVAGALVLAEDVPLDAAEDIHLALILGLELGDGGLILGGAAGAHAVFTVALGVAMAREAQCGQPLRTGSAGHLLQGVFAVTHRRVTMYTGLLIICHSELTASFPV